MANKDRMTYRICLLLLCMAQALGMAVHGQDRPRAEIKRLRAGNDSISQTVLPADTLQPEYEVADSIAAENKRKMLEMTAAPQAEETELPPDTLLQYEVAHATWIPEPSRATWLALVFPGGGQIYNRKFWKLPIFYGGFAGCAYALSWNGNMYRDYFNAYRDAANGDWDSSNITELIPAGYLEQVSQTQLLETLRKRKDRFRRYRDLSIFAFIGVYLLSIVDAYVDAELSNFDITPDLSMSLGPAVIDTNEKGNFQGKSVGLQCSLRF